MPPRCVHFTSGSLRISSPRESSGLPGAAATLIGKLPSAVPIILAIFSALLSAYTIAVNLDSTIRTMAKLHYSWSEVAHGYEALWNRTYADDADERFDSLTRRERDLSEVATTDAPNNPERLRYWQLQVFKQHHLIVNE